MLTTAVAVSTKAMIISDSQALICGTGTGPSLVTPEERSASPKSLTPMKTRMMHSPACR